ncbi:MAG TPA: two-component regulator propeller domain-containing protein [Pyrinomonadaceae bacterium]|nr:two-component regulator propeller domain-containing protein [Pyrinomonadaceae bacterium]
MIRALIPFCLILLFISAAVAQYRIENWSTEQGLPYKTVRSVLQTEDGYLWAATSDGLARFDGVRFTVYNTTNSPNLTKNRLEFLAQTTDGSLWISGENGGLFRLRRDGAFSSLSTAEGLPSDLVFSIHADKEANRLTILTQRGIAVWEDEKITSVEPLPAPNHRYASLLDNKGEFCIKENDIVRRRTASGVIEYKLPEDLPDTVLAQVYEDREGAVWIGVFHLPRPGKAKLYVFKNNRISIFDERDGLPNAFMGKILEDRQGDVWIASGKFEEGGLVKFENGKLRRFTKEDGFVGVGVLGLTEDREGGIWAGISDNGLTRISRRFITSYTKEKNGLSSNNIYPLYEDADGEIWSGAWRYGSERIGGIDKFEDGGFKHFAGEDQITSLAPNSLFKDREGNLWIGALGGLTKYKDGKFVKYTPQNGFPHGSVNAITQTRDGTLWLATEEGLTRLRDNQFTEFTTSDGLPHTDLRKMYEARDGTLWIATMGGLGSYKDGVFTKYPGIPPIQIRSIYEDADGTLWFGSYDAGVFRYKNGEFKEITVKDGLFDQGAFQILEDDFGRFWISSNRGIYRIGRQELNDFADGKIQKVTSIGYGVKDGMADAECNGGSAPAGFKSRKDGTLWFPTQKGIAVIDPRALPVNSQPPNVAIEYCLVDGKEADCQNINILPENYSLEIKYTGLSFNKPEQTKFKYKLEGLDENWIDAGTRRRAFFTHLPPGEYSFKVSAANVDGVWNETGASLKIKINPPFYQTLWFGSLCVLTVGGILFFGYRRQIQHLEKQRAVQEEFSRKLIDSQESERQRIASELHDSLGQDLLIIKNWALIGLKNGRDSSKQLGEISETASAAIDEVREIAYNLRPFHLDELGLTKAVESMLDRVSKSSTIDFVQEIDSIDEFFPREAEINFYRIVQECVNNIVKHSKATKARVKIKRTGSRNLQFSIWDNGTGFETDAAALKRANQSGFGLAGINERARILGGKLVIDSAPNDGTTVKLTFV